MLQKTAVTHLSIAELERSINYWRRKNPSDAQSMKLCHQASQLAELYGHWIIHGIESAELTDLTAEQLELIKLSD